MVGSVLVRRTFAAFLILFFGFYAAPSASAQVGGGVVHGVLADEQSGALPGATVTLRNIDTGTVRTTTSESDGRYRFAALPPGRYELTAELSGFAAVVVQNITMSIGLELQHDITMRLQGVNETLTITGVAPVVETTRSEVAAIVTQEQIDMLPVEG